MQKTSNDCLFERSEKLAILAVDDPKLIPEYESVMAEISKLEGGWKVKTGRSQNVKILRHLQAGKTISPLEAMGVFGGYSLAARIYELRVCGWDITKQIKYDGQGRTYAEYSLA